jgi:hypothetical protein
MCKLHQPLLTNKFPFLKQQCHIEDEAAPKKASSNSWDPRDDDLLYEVVIKCKNDWKRVTKAIFEKTSKSIPAKTLRKRYQLVMNFKKRERAKFTHEDDKKIVKAIQEFGLDWSKIAQSFGDMPPNMLKNRYYSYIRKRDLFSSYLEEIEEKVVISRIQETDSPKAWPGEFRSRILTINEETSYFKGFQISLEMNSHYFIDQLKDKITDMSYL